MVKYITFYQCSHFYSRLWVCRTPGGSGLPGGRALTPLVVTLWPCRWAAAGLARACCVSPPQLTDGEVEHFLILQEEDV